MTLIELIVVVTYLLVIGYLGYLGYRNTHTSEDYNLAGRNIHPFVMALSYGATFISTSAIVGFGGAAGLFGMGLLWLTVLNVFVGIFIAFVFLGGPTRRIGHRLGAHTFPELLGRRFESRFVQVFAGLVIFLFMPLYSTAVLLGGAEFVQVIFHLESFNVALFILALVIGAYVLAGGLKGVMYNDALQGGIMLGGMILLVVFTYTALGGITTAHKELGAMAHLVPAKLQTIGHNGWTTFPDFGWGDIKHNLWWIMVSTLVLGVGIGVLAQPQMAVRFMTVKSKREINRAVAVGGIFIMFLTGVAFTVGALSNVYFYRHETVQGTIVNRDEISTLQQSGEPFPAGTTAEVRTAGLDVSVKVPLGAESTIEWGADGQPDVIRPKMIAVARTGGATDQIIPTFIASALPRWFGIVFLLTLLSAAMSTLSSQFHAMGTSIGRDIMEQVIPDYNPSDRRTVTTTRVGIIIGLIASLLLADVSRDYIAISTALFFGLCASSFLPTFIGALFWRRITRAAAITSMVGGFSISLFWMLFIYQKTAAGIGFCKFVTGEPVLLSAPNWQVVDPIMVGLPCSILLVVVVSLLTAPPSEKLLEKVYGK